MKKTLLPLAIAACLSLNGCSNDFESGLLMGAGVAALMTTSVLVNQNTATAAPRPSRTYSIPYSTYRNYPYGYLGASTPQREHYYLVTDLVPTDPSPTPLYTTPTSGQERWDWDDDQTTAEPQPTPSSSPSPLPVLILEPATTQDAFRVFSAPN